ncbi:MAG TPA: benzoate-CoA ligase family protein [Arenicellales bacterium]|nr:benzoate-CoA ligase family protein [Arenicellales bacterium]
MSSRTLSPLELPRMYNATTHFIDRHLDEGRADKIALIDEQGSYTYAELAERVNRAAGALLQLGLEPEQRVLLCLLDTIDFPAVFWGAIKAGLVPVPVNTLLTEQDYTYMLDDSRARALVVSSALYDGFAGHLVQHAFLEQVIVAGGDSGDHLALDELLAAGPAVTQPASTTCDDTAFWLYTSGSTGTPKGAVHQHSDLVQTAHLYGKGVLGIREDDIVFSAAKLFFAYGLGNAMSFPLHVGATAVLLAERPTPDAVLNQLERCAATIFYGVPTLYGAILAEPNNDQTRVSDQLRLCVSAGEALPEEVSREWERRFRVPILDGLGSTEMLHIFLSNRPDDMRYGSTGKPVPGYELRVVDEHDVEVATGEIGELLVRGPSSASCYWNQRDKSLNTFQGEWTRSGDKYFLDEEGYYRYCGRTDDMLKVGGIWVSPFEVESALLAESRVLEAAVVGQQDEQGLVKPKAVVVLQQGVIASAALVSELQAFVKERLAPFKYPRWIEFIEELPKTATGKIQRFKLRVQDEDDD